MNEKIIASWSKNAAEWVRIVEENQIESRKFTNQAIVDELEKVTGNKIVDIGCGEGWLTRAMTKMGKTAVGLDATLGLLAYARWKGQETYHEMTYAEIINGVRIPEAPFNMAVFNFSLYQSDGLDALLNATKKQLDHNGEILIQTLHPFFLFDHGLEYKSQMVSNSWKGLPGNFIDGHEWYARTLEDWTKVVIEAGLQLLGIKEILNSQKRPVSLILRLR